MTEYLIVFKGDNFDPIHAMSFDAAVERVEEWIGNGAEIRYALEVEDRYPGGYADFPMPCVCTEKLNLALECRELAREAEAAKAYADSPLERVE